MEIKIVNIEKPKDMNIILGQAHFIKTIEDIYEILVSSVPNIKFGVAFCESSGPRLLRISGNDDKLIELAKKNGMAIRAGHSFIIFLENAYPINVLPAIKSCPEVCRIFCATANTVQVIIGETDLPDRLQAGKGRAILGVVDGGSTLGIETEKDIEVRKKFLINIGYKT